MLSDKEIIYALHTHNVRTDSIPKYLENYKKTVQLIENKKEEISCDLVASWTVQVGDMDQVLHLWRYTGGFEAIDQAKVRTTSSHLSTEINRNRLLSVHAHFDADDV